MSKKIIQSTMIQVIVPANTTPTQIMIPDQPNLRAVKLHWVQAFYDNITAFSPINGTPVIAKGNFALGFITLQDYGGFNFLDKAPLMNFQTIENAVSASVNAAGANIPQTIQEKDFKALNGQYCNWPKSFITFSVAPSPVANDTAILLQVGYEDPAYNPPVPEQFIMREKKK